MPIYLSNRDGNGKTNEEGHYRLLSRVIEGTTLTPTDLKVTQNTTPGMSVIVNAGDYNIPTSGGYSYMGWNSANTTLSISASNPSNPRITLVVLYVDKQAATSPTPPNNPGITKLAAINGAASSSPVSPSSTAIQNAIGAGNPYIVLASINVAAGTSTILNSNITDTRELIELSSDIISAQKILQLVGPLMMPIGTVYENPLDQRNPAIIFGFGTWSPYGEGRTVVGVSVGDSDFGSPNKTGGVKTVTLTEAQMPNHSHVVNPPSTSTSTNGSHSHAVDERFIRDVGYGNGNVGSTGTGDRMWRNLSSIAINSAGNHTHSVNIPAFNSGSRGSSQSHDNLMPYITAYRWVRTA